MPQVINASHAKQNFSSILNNAYYKGEEYILQRHGKPVIIISPITGTLPANSSASEAVKNLGKVSLNVPDEWQKVEKELDDMNT